MQGEIIKSLGNGAFLPKLKTTNMKNETIDIEYFIKDMIKHNFLDYEVMVPTLNKEEYYTNPRIVDEGIMELLSELKIKGIYFLYFKGDLVYIGVSTKNIISRIRDHMENKLFDSYLFCDADDKGILRELCEIEPILIKKYCPEYNSLSSIALKVVKCN